VNDQREVRTDHYSAFGRRLLVDDPEAEPEAVLLRSA
jgi:hypothetical protein